MRIQTYQAIPCRHGFATDSHGMAFDPEQAVAHVARLVTNHGQTTIRKQLVETALLLAVISEIVVIFVGLGW